MRSALKLLPWFARKAGVSDELATKLWRRAIQEAELIAGGNDSPAAHALALDRFTNLLELEADADICLDSSRYSWAWRHPERMARCSLTATTTINRAWLQFMQRMRQPQTV